MIIELRVQAVEGTLAHEDVTTLYYQGRITEAEAIELHAIIGANWE